VIVGIDLSLDIPPYEQIRGAIVAAVRRRELAAGTRLPTVRQLARDLDVSPATVARAYRELERDGVIHGAGRKGTFVAAITARAQESLDAQAREFVERARRDGADRTAIMHAVIDALEAEGRSRARTVTKP
jgi:DNA-binding transcriptional regulator YhcF (GntR family)